MQDKVPGVVTLITPPSAFLLDERVFISLGILKVAAVLEQAGLQVEMLDLSGISNFEKAARDHARKTEAVHFGITVTTPQLPAARLVVEAIREVRPDAKIIMGGPHVTLTVAATRRERAKGIKGRAHEALDRLFSITDTLVAGDGERAIFSALTSTERLIDADSNKSDLWVPNAELSSLPLPARHLVDVRSYGYEIEGHQATSLIAQLGCPFECGFCGGRYSPTLRQIRTRDSQSIVDELVHLYEVYGFTGFMFYDDELNVNLQMVELMEMIARKQEELGVEWRLRGFIKAQLFTDEQAEAMYKAGFRWILVGFESGSPRILTNINKRSTREENTRCMEIANRHGLKVKALMSIGHPGETDETVQDTHDWLLEVRPEDFDATIITTYPGTPYYDDAVPNGNGVWVYTYGETGDQLFSLQVDFDQVAEYYKGDPNEDDGYKVFVFTEALSGEDLKTLRDWTERDVREKLGIPWNQARPAMLYEHSMGQHGKLPPNILRTTSPTGDR